MNKTSISPRKMEKIKYSLLLIILFISCEVVEKKPNIIVFLVDDMGWQDTSVPFHTEVTKFNQRYETPNMERLADQGMKFTQAYSCSVCSPTRVSLMTGMNAARHRVTNWTLRYNVSNDRDHPVLIFPEWNMNGMSPEASIENTVHATSLPQLLQKEGYITVHVGKAHLGAINTPGADPLNLGFDINVAGHAAGAPASYYGEHDFGNNKPDNVWAVPGLEKYHGEDIFLTDALTKEAIRHLTGIVEKGDPFYLYMSHYAVHAPIQADSSYFRKYLEEGIDTIEARYASMIEGMDKSLGDLMDFVNKNDIEDETIILFTSDNGGLSAAARGGAPHTHNKPLNSGKGSAYEGGIREPMIVKWSGVTEPGSETDNYVIIEDFFPTILEMAGAENYETIQKVDGVSFTGILKGKEQRDHERPLFWHYPNRWGHDGPGIGPSSTIRKGEWKLIYYHADRRFELFNIPDDIGEHNDLSDERTDLVEGLALELGSYLRYVEAQMPYDSIRGKTVEYPDEIEL